MLIIYCQGEQGEGIPGPPGPPGPPGGITVCKLFFSKWYIKELFYNLVNTLLFDSRDSVLCMLFFVGGWWWYRVGSTGQYTERGQGMLVTDHLSYSVTRKQLTLCLIVVSCNIVIVICKKSCDNKDCSQVSYPRHFYPFFSFDPFIKHPPLDTQPIKCY